MVGHSMCTKADPLKSDDISCCAPGEECCDGQCCSSVNSCQEKPEPRNGWKDIDGTPVEPGHVCLSEAAGHMHFAPAVRAIVYPLVLSLSILVSAFVVLKVFSSLPIGFRLSCFVLMLCSVAIVHGADSWKQGVLLPIGVLVVMTLASSAYYKIAFMALLLQYFLQTSLFNETTKSINDEAFLRSMGECAEYYGYFKKSVELRSWDVSAYPADDANAASRNSDDGFDLFYGLCSHGWLSVLDLCKAATYPIMLLVGTTLILMYANADLKEQPGSGPGHQPTSSTASAGDVNNPMSGVPPPGGDVEMKPMSGGHGNHQSDELEYGRDSDGIWKMLPKGTSTASPTGAGPPKLNT